jgi:hypothetical protein
MSPIDESCLLQMTHVSVTQAFNASAESDTSYECRFESQVQQEPTRPHITAHTPARLISPTLITCQAPEWSHELWQFYRQDLEGKALVQIVSKSAGTLGSTVVSSVSGDVFYSFTATNKAPDFMGSSLGTVSRLSYDSPPIVFSNWTRRIWKGRLANHEDAPDEADQLLTFVVRARVPPFFEASHVSYVMSHVSCICICIYHMKHETRDTRHET